MAALDGKKHNYVLDKSFRRETWAASAGVEELDQTKLTPLLRLKYHDSITLQQQTTVA